MPPKRKTPSTTSTTTGTSRPISSFFSRGGRTTSAPNPLFYKTDPLGWDAVKILNTSPSKHEKHEGGIINIYRDQEEQMNLQTICCVCGKDIGKGLSMQVHVNQCLDNPALESRVEKPKDPPDMKPICVEEEEVEISCSKNHAELEEDWSAKRVKVDPQDDRIQPKTMKLCEPVKETSPTSFKEEKPPSLWNRLLNSYSSLVPSYKKENKLMDAMNIEYAEEWNESARDYRACPFYKYLPGTKWTVDAFKFGKVENVDAYLLSHFHADHYGGLMKSWTAGPIFCSDITANLIAERIKVDEQYLIRFPMNTVVERDGNHLLLVDANHCPGSVIFVIKPAGSSLVHVHVGDFRYHPEMHTLDAFIGPFKEYGVTGIQNIYLDTTYCGEAHIFPSQDTIIRLVRNKVAGAAQSLEGFKQAVKRSYKTTRLPDQEDLQKWISTKPIESNDISDKVDERPFRLLVCIGTYLIGKERVFKAAAEALETPIYCAPYKGRIMACLEDTDLNARLTTVQKDAQVHLCRIGDVNNPDSLQDYLSQQPSFTHLIAFRPTGWTFKKANLDAEDGYLMEPHVLTRDHRVAIFGVPYSEHSSYPELEQFVKTVPCRKIISTVGMGNEKNREKVNGYLKRWRTEVEKDKARAMESPLD